MSGNSFVCAQDQHIKAYKTAYLFGCIEAYRGLCVSLSLSLHHFCSSSFKTLLDIYLREEEVL